MRERTQHMMGLEKLDFYGQPQLLCHSASFPIAPPSPELCGNSTTPSSRKCSQLWGLNGVAILLWTPIWPEMIETQMWASSPALSESILEVLQTQTEEEMCP